MQVGEYVTVKVHCACIKYSFSDIPDGMEKVEISGGLRQIWDPLKVVVVNNYDGSATDKNVGLKRVKNG